ncbi:MULTISPECIES: LysR family transcriptional regulator [Paraburkholderia]|uniref:HTH-type transcriptional regulator GltR n=2 Tax=Paraburkholderia TaxID=1822464 RepID=A0A6J5FJJ3_9BURK|nr:MULTISPECIES: LysR family transcriptional regulator [Paraburkholderia]GGC65719.1 LysR family transcriptional regulator [Paraburkholderia caffeinilytica]CAB3781719.1 HTH-type transcriptional regulator GltR [Paraburkholderia caffeinitolerans]CAB3802080.1 HTH-type transcriptional regulator GltR [Paraburkholderia caffeinilytica]
MNLRFLETFVWAARLNSFRLAAEKLNLSQATISARIAALEQELGIKLFQRSGRDTSLTVQGERALTGADELLRAAAKFRLQLNGLEHARGTIRIGVIDAIAFTLLPLIVDRLNTTYPNVNFELHADTSINLARQLTESKLHLALLMGPVHGTDIVSRPMFNLSATWIAGPSFPNAETPIDLDVLVSHPIISFPKGSDPHETMRGYFRRDVFQAMRVYTSNSVATIVKLVSDGLGVAVLPEAIVKDEITSGKLLKLDVIQPFPAFAFHLAYVDAPETSLPGLIADLVSAAAHDYCRQETSRVAWVP